MLTLWNEAPVFGWRGLSDLQRDLERFVDGPTRTDGAVRPGYDVEEKDGDLTLTLEMPGVPKEKLAIELAERKLTVTGEAPHRKYEARFEIPVTVDGEKISADYRDGVLRLGLPKAEAAKPRQIRIGDTAALA